MPEWITKYWVEWLFGIVAAALLALYKKLSGRIKKQAEERDALRDGMRSLLRRQIIEDCERAIQAGYCLTSRRDTILDMYDAYKKLGGNGAVTRIKDEMMELQSVKEGKQ